MSQLLDVGPEVHAALGDRVLADLRSVLHPVDCQVCGRGFDATDEPTVAVDALNDMAFAGLYHKHCRPSEWRTGTAGSRQLSWRAAPLVGSTATLVVNPSCEGAFLRRCGTRWRLSTLDVYTDTGFHRGPAEPARPLPDLEIQLDTDEITACRVRIQEPTVLGPGIGGLPPDFIWRTGISPAFYEKARAHNQITVCVSDAFDPNGDLAQVHHLIADGSAVHTVAPITLFSPAAQVVAKTDQTVTAIVATYLRGPVHVMTPDLATAHAYEHALSSLNRQVERADGRARTTRRTVVVGTCEQFAAAWECPESTVAGATGQGCLALVVAPAPDLTSQRFMRRYARRLDL